MKLIYTDRIASLLVSTILMSTAAPLLSIGESDYWKFGLQEKWEALSATAKQRITSAQDIDEAFKTAKVIDQKDSLYQPVLTSKSYSESFLRAIAEFESNFSNLNHRERSALVALNDLLTRYANEFPLENSNEIKAVIKPFFTRRLGYNKHHSEQALDELIKAHKKIPSLKYNPKEQKRIETFYKVIWQGDNEEKSSTEMKVFPGAIKALRALGALTEADNLDFEKFRVKVRVGVDKNLFKLQKIWTRHVTGETPSNPWDAIRQNAELNRLIDYLQNKSEDSESETEKMWFLSRSEKITPLLPNFVDEEDLELEKLINEGRKDTSQPSTDFALKIANKHFANMKKYSDSQTDRSVFCKTMRDGKEKLRQLWKLKSSHPKDSWEDHLMFRQFVGLTAHLDNSQGQTIFKKIWEASMYKEDLGEY